VKNSASNSNARQVTHEDALHQIYLHEDHGDHPKVMSAAEMTGKGLSKFYQTYGRRIHHHIIEEKTGKRRAMSRP
jgi:hypothetical protein